MTRRTRVLALLLALLLGMWGGVATLEGRQPFSAQIQVALQTLGLWPYGVYATGDTPVWDNTAQQFEPSSGGVVTAAGFRAGVTPTDCSAPQYSFQGDTNTGIGYVAADAIATCLGAQFGSVWTTTTATLAFSAGRRNYWDATQYSVGSGVFIGFSNVADPGVGTADVRWFREAADHGFRRNGTAAQRESWANTYAGAASYEAFSVDWQTVANVAGVGTRTAATGTGRVLQLQSQSDNAADFYSAIRLNGRATPLLQQGYLNAAGSGRNDNATGTYFQWGIVTNTASSGTPVNTAFTPTWNQTGTAGGTDILINRTETALGSGNHYFMEGQIAGSQQWHITRLGGAQFDNGVAIGGTVTPGSSRLIIAQGSIAGDAPTIDATTTWNNAGVSFAGFKLNVTDSASASSSVPVLIQVSNNNIFRVRKDGNIMVDQQTLGNAVNTLSSVATNDDPTEVMFQGRVTTVGNAATTINTITIPTSTSTLIECRVVARRTGGASGAAEDGGGWYIWVAVKNTAGTVAEYAAETITTVGESTAGFNVTAVPSGATELIQVTGALTTDITWHSTCRTYGVNS